MPEPQYSIVYYATSNGRQPVEDFLNDLRKSNMKAYGKCLSYVQRLQVEGVQLDSHFVEKMKSVKDVWELRPEHLNVEYRILFGVVGKEIILVWAGIKKGRGLRQGDIDLAQQRVDECKTSSS